MRYREFLVPVGLSPRRRTQRDQNIGWLLRSSYRFQDTREVVTTVLSEIRMLEAKRDAGYAK